MSVLRTVPALLALALGVIPAFAGNAAREMGPRQHRVVSGADNSGEARVIVKYKSGSSVMRALSATSGEAVRPQHAGALGQRLGLPLQDGRILGARMQALRGQGLTSAELAARLQQQADVEWAVVDERRTISAAPNDPLYAANASISPAAGQWYLRKPDAAVSPATSSSTVVSSVDAEAAWAITTGSASVTVAVLDTGMRFDHPDFVKTDGSSKLRPGYDFVSTQTGDGNARDNDASDPGDYTTSTTCGSGTTVSSSSWHGTQTAGIVGAATNNATGMAGIGRDVMVLPVRVLGPCGGNDSDIIAAMYWSAGIAIPGDTSTPANPHPAKVVSMSLGKTGRCPSSYNDVFSALTAAKVTVVVAAGNDAGLAVNAPANCAGAIAVAGVRHIGSKVGYSNVGPEVTIAAPAGNCVNLNGACLYPILTTINNGSTTPTSNGYSDSSNYSVGTSFAAPIVAGTVGLMYSVDPSLTPAQIKAALQSTARPFPTSGSTETGVLACRAPTAVEQIECYCTTSTCGAGLLDAGKAVAAVVPAVAPPTAAITVSASSVTAGLSITLNASNASANGGRSIAGYQWAISSGGGSAAFSGSTTGSSATLVTSAAGTVVVSLTVTDSAGSTGSASTTLTVQAAPVVSTPEPSTPSSTGGGGGGGGAMSAGWVALLGLAAWVLRSSRRSKRA